MGGIWDEGCSGSEQTCLLGSYSYHLVVEAEGEMPQEMNLA